MTPADTLPLKALHIGDWIADPRTNELRRGEETVRLEPRAMDLLMTLARRAGSVVGREELFAAVWPGMVVGDEALTQGITKLRRAFGDDARAPSYIETISKRGYRMKAAVRPEGASAAPVRRALWRWAAVAAVLVVAIGAGGFLRQVDAPAPQTTAGRHAVNPEAYEHFARAQALFLARTPHQNEEARALYRTAVEIDPQFARAYAGLAMTFAMEARLRGAGAERTASLERAMELAESARLIDPEIAEVHWALGFVHAQARRHPQAIESLQRAIDLDPSFADAYALMGGILTYVGQPAKSIPLLRTAMRLDREAGYLYFLLLGRAYFFENDREQAEINLRQALQRNPSDIETRLYLAANAMASGKRAAAEWEIEEIRAMEPRFSLEAWMRSYPMSSAGHRQRLQAMLAAAGI